MFPKTHKFRESDATTVSAITHTQMSRASSVTQFDRLLTNQHAGHMIIAVECHCLLGPLIQGKYL